MADLALHFSVLVSLAELEQLRRGFELQKFSVLISKHPQVMRKAFLPPVQAISADFLQDIFEPILAPRGINKREAEEAVLLTWHHYTCIR